jgi:hypothetical protein
MYYRHRRSVPPPFPSLTLCAQPQGQTCFGDDPYFDEVPESCQKKGECPFWSVWETWANHGASEYITEIRVLIRVERYRRVVSRRRLRRR